MPEHGVDEDALLYMHHGSEQDESIMGGAVPELTTEGPEARGV